MSPDDPFFNEALRIEAEALARRTGMAPSRLVSIFEALAVVGWLAPNFPWNTALDEAAAFVGTERALAIFEQEDLLTLARHVSVVEFLMEDELAPAFTHEELAADLTSVLAHFESNRDSWLQIGYPATGMPVLGWLRLRLDCLLPVKEPWQDVESGLAYRWEADPPDPPLEISVGGGLLYFPAGRLLRDTLPSFVGYSDAPILGCLTPTEADRAVDLRSRLLDSGVMCSLSYSRRSGGRARMRSGRARSRASRSI
jgi:hypothetical protein